jgi:hypothetical protein
MSLISTPFVTCIARIVACRNLRVSPFSLLSLLQWKKDVVYEINTSRARLPACLPACLAGCLFCLSVRPSVCLSYLVSISACEPVDQFSQNLVWTLRHWRTPECRGQLHNFLQSVITKCRCENLCCGSDTSDTLGCEVAYSNSNLC